MRYDKLSEWAGQSAIELLGQKMTVTFSDGKTITGSLGKHKLYSANPDLFLDSDELSSRDGRPVFVVDGNTGLVSGVFEGVESVEPADETDPTAARIESVDAVMPGDIAVFEHITGCVVETDDGGDEARLCVSCPDKWLTDRKSSGIYVRNSAFRYAVRMALPDEDGLYVDSYSDLFVRSEGEWRMIRRRGRWYISDYTYRPETNDRDREELLFSMPFERVVKIRRRPGLLGVLRILFCYIDNYHTNIVKDGRKQHDRMVGKQDHRRIGRTEGLGRHEK